MLAVLSGESYCIEDNAPVQCDGNESISNSPSHCLQCSIADLKYLFKVRPQIRTDTLLNLRSYVTDSECVDLKDVRNKHFVASSIKDLFHSIEAHKIIDFITETRFYKQL